MRMSICLHVCLHVGLMPGAHRGEKKVSDPQQLEFRMVVNHPVGTRNCTQGLCKSSQCP